MQNRLKQHVLGCVTLLMVITACIKPPTASSQYEITRFKRKNPHDKPCLAGRIDQPFERDGRAQYIGVFVDTTISYPDTAGNFYVVSNPGTHTLRFGTVGLRLISIKYLRLHTGDSIRFNVHMQQDTTNLREHYH
jgi:hypothetical protein